ncbi:hypothetical protein, partial [Deinococcus pimensis]|uniref:hypothetical protein n=1 Tax=Deinococcus pimensis TaxID=309888 RepID=UPI000693D696
MNTLRVRTALTSVALLAALPGAGAATAWGSVNLTTQTAGVSGGFSILPVPFVGTLGLEAAVDRPYGTDGTQVSVGATLRDLNLPATGTDAFVGLGVTLLNPGTATYVEGGLRAPLVGPLGLKLGVRVLPGTGA